MDEKPVVIALMGPTACGKTDLAVKLCDALPVEIISVDSALVYRGMNLGTAKPDTATLLRAPHHLIDILDPHQSYSVAQFRTDALRLIAEIHGRGRLPLLVGGTMLYFHALKLGMDDLPESDPALRATLDARAEAEGWPALHAELVQLDPGTAARLAPNDSQRIQRALEVCLLSGRPMSSLIGSRATENSFRLIEMALLPSDRAVLHARIAQRFEAMLKAGFVDEVRHLRTDPRLHPGLPSMRCVGYRQAWAYLDGTIDLTTFRDKSIAATRQLAKRQITWLRGWNEVQPFDCLDPQMPEAVWAYLRQMQVTTGMGTG